MPFYESPATESWPYNINIMGLPTSIYSPFQNPKPEKQSPQIQEHQANNERLDLEDTDPFRSPQTIVFAEVYSPNDTSSPFFRSPPNRTNSTRSIASTSSSSSTESTPTLPPPLFPLFPSPWSAQFTRSRPNLRRKRLPHSTNLRQLREKSSEETLQKQYEKQTLSYLDGSVFITPEPCSLPAFRLLLTLPE
jgi:hypothetical protein